ncbi:MAG: polyprenyl diphosphate synthase [Candidatus Micrarchaeia archaeon]
MSQEQVNHIAFIPDGNRRWAKKHGLDVLRGHERGIDRMGDVLKWCRDAGIKTVSFWAFSTENFNRDKEEVEGLFVAFEVRLAKIMKEAEFERHQVRVRFVGERERFPKKIQMGMKKIEDDTKKYDKYFLNMFIGYGGRPELVDAAKKLAKDFASNPQKITEAEFEKRLWSAGVPDPELIVRTSGEMRLSGFLPFQSTYSELYFCQKLWPEFEQADFESALQEFSNRKRRWGK